MVPVGTDSNICAFKAPPFHSQLRSSELHALNTLGVAKGCCLLVIYH